MSVGSVLLDLRLALRGLQKSPQFTAAAILILGLGVGANTSVFSILDAVFFEDAPHVAAPDRLVRLYATSARTETAPIPYRTFEYLRDNQESLAGLMGYGEEAVDLTMRVAGARDDGTGWFVSPEYFDVLGTRPALGRWFRPEEDRPDAASAVAVISHGLWTRMFGGDPAIVGRFLELNGVSFTVVGVTPGGFRGPSPLEPPPEVWLPFRARFVLAENSPDATEFLTRSAVVVGVGRLRDGSRVEAAQANLDGLSAALVEAGGARESSGVRLYPDARFHPSVAAGTSGTARLLLAAAAAILLVACANIAILLLARGSIRARMVAVQMALGARRATLVRGALMESLILAAGGAILGILLSNLTTGLLARAFASPFSVSFEPDGTVFLFVCALTVATAFLFGILPALRTGRVDVNRTLTGYREATERSRIRGGLVVTQVAVAVSLAVAAGVLTRSFAVASAVPLGYEVGDRVLLTTNFITQGYSIDEAEIVRAQALERLRAVPGVRSAAVLSAVPMGEGRMNQLILPPEGASMGDGPVGDRSAGDGPAGDALVMGLNLVDSEYLRTMGLEMLSGRGIVDADGPDAPPVLVVSASTARMLWPGQDPIGRQVRGTRGQVLFEVVGVVEDARVDGLGDPPGLYGYASHTQRRMTSVTFVVHGDVGAEGLRQEFFSLDPGLAFDEVRTMESVVDRRVGRFRTAALLVGGFGAIGLVLAVVGLYGVLSYSVAQTRGEIGIRVALGASSRRVGRDVLARAARWTGAGLAVGGILAFASTPLLQAFLFGVEAQDPWAVASAMAVVLVTSLAAGTIPALRAARIDPMVALRGE